MGLRQERRSMSERRSQRVKTSTYKEGLSQRCSDLNKSPVESYEVCLFSVFHSVLFFHLPFPQWERVSANGKPNKTTSSKCRIRTAPGCCAPWQTLPVISQDSREMQWTEAHFQDFVLGSKRAKMTDKEKRKDRKALPGLIFGRSDEFSWDQMNLLPSILFPALYLTPRR